MLHLAKRVVGAVVRRNASRHWLPYLSNTACSPQSAMSVGHEFTLAQFSQTSVYSSLLSYFISRMSASQYTFTRCQLDQYFDHIKLPAKYRPTSTSRLDVNYLKALHIHHISTIPYENLALHYSLTRTISLKPEDLFNKFVTKGCNRGGYCMENSLFFTYVLRSLGFDAYPTGARIRLREDGVPTGDYIGL